MRDLLTSVPPVVRNARRLLQDAELLAQNERHASAFVLATLALEEVGKVVLAFWGDDPAVKEVTKGSSQHVQKQCAAAALLMADLTHASVQAHVVSKGLASARELTDDDVPAAVSALTQAMSESLDAELFERAAGGILDTLKQVGLYVDEGFAERDFTHEGFDEGDAARACDEARRALNLLRDVEKFYVARVLFLTEPVTTRLRLSRKVASGFRKTLSDGGAA